MTYITEQPVVAGAVLAVLGIGLLIAWVRGGVGKVAVAGLVCLAMIPIVFAIGASIETERELIQRTLKESAREIREASAGAGDYAKAVALIADDTERDAAKRLLKTYRPQQATITGFRSIKINQGTPMTAKVDLNARGRVKSPRIRNPDGFTVPRRIILEMRKDGEAWKVVSFQHLPIAGRADSFSNKKLSDLKGR
ncbi:MAG: hypothetical protein AAF958_09355 [Planctomycetota bacterium]